MRVFQVDPKYVNLFGFFPLAVIVFIKLGKDIHVIIDTVIFRADYGILFGNEAFFALAIKVEYIKVP